LGEVYIAPFDVILSESDIVEPDVIFVSNARRAIITEDNIRGVPDLLVEVVSPTRPAMDTRDKRNVYQRCGVPFYWIVDPDQRRVTELKLTGDHYETASEPQGTASFTPQLFPDLIIAIERLWA
jgi:Uma2 family endonuclease